VTVDDTKAVLRCVNAESSNDSSSSSSSSSSSDNDSSDDDSIGGDDAAPETSGTGAAQGASPAVAVGNLPPGCVLPTAILNRDERVRYTSDLTGACNNGRRVDIPAVASVGQSVVAAAGEAVATEPAEKLVDLPENWGF
jgi:hypothetical protein